MAWTFQQQIQNWTYPATSSGQTITFGNNCTPGSLMFAMVSAFNNSITSTAVSDPTNGTWNYIANVVGGYGNMSIYWVLNTAATALAVSWVDTLAYPGFQAIEFTGNKSSSPLDNYATSTGVTGVAVVATNANELVIGFPCPSSGGNMETTTGWTSTVPSDTSGQPMIYAIKASAGTYTPTFTNSGGVFSASWLPATVAAALPPLRMMMGCGT